MNILNRKDEKRFKRGKDMNVMPLSASKITILAGAASLQTVYTTHTRPCSVSLSLTEQGHSNFVIYEGITINTHCLCLLSFVC